MELSECGNAAHVDGNGVQRDGDDGVSLELLLVWRELDISDNSRYATSLRHLHV
jgi:hypothetical protein